MLCIYGFAKFFISIKYYKVLFSCLTRSDCMSVSSVKGFLVNAVTKLKCC